MLSTIQESNEYRERIVANRNIKKGHILDREDIQLYSIDINSYYLGLKIYFQKYISKIRRSTEVEVVYQKYFIADKDKLNKILGKNFRGKHFIKSDVDKEYLIEEINKLLFMVTTDKNPFYDSEYNSITDSVAEELLVVLKIKSFLGLRAVEDISDEEELKLTLLEDPELLIQREEIQLYKNKIKLQIENNLWL